MTTGKRLAGLLLLTTALTIPGAAFAQDSAGSAVSPTQADVERDELLDDEPEGQEDDFQDTDVSIPGGSIIVTGRINRNPERNSTQVVNVLSTEQIARTGEGVHLLQKRNLVFKGCVF